jgi:hypothetical protein
MADVSVSSVAIRALVAKMATATDASVRAARDSIIGSALQLREAIGGSWVLAIWDPQGPERKLQQKNLSEAIDKVKAAKDTESIKKALIYLQATIDITRTFYSNNDSFSRAFDVFIKDVKNAPSLLVEKVVAPIVKGAAEIGGKTLWAVIKGLWPILLLVLGVVIIYSVGVRRLAK